MTRVRAGRQRDLGRLLAAARDYFLPKCPDQLQGPPILYYWGAPSLRVKRLRRELDLSLSGSDEIKNGWCYKYSPPHAILARTGT